MSSTLKLLFWFGVFDLSIQWIGFVFSAHLQTEVFFDLVGSLSFFLVATGSLATGGFLNERQVMVTTLVSVWSVRLGTFLLMRVLKVGKDSRFDGVRNKPSMLFVFWNIQAFWVFVVSLPVMLLNLSTHNPPWLAITDIIGMLLWSTGFLLEAVADYQKFVFKEDEANAEKWIDTGLWKFCRHPNYLGEILLWWGVFFTASGGLKGWGWLAGLVGPVWTTIQLYYVSGVPLLEVAADKKWGEDPHYQSYKKSTPNLFPWPFRHSHGD